MTNIRKAVNSMTDEELADLFANAYTVDVNGKLRDCDGMACQIECPLWESTEECVDVTRKYMLKEAICRI